MSSEADPSVAGRRQFGRCPPALRGHGGSSARAIPDDPRQAAQRGAGIPLERDLRRGSAGSGPAGQSRHRYPCPDAGAGARACQSWCSRVSRMNRWETQALKEGAQDYLVKGQVDSKLLARSHALCHRAQGGGRGADRARGRSRQSGNAATLATAADRGA